MSTELPETLAELARDLAEVDEPDRLPLLMEIAEELPDAPAEMAADPTTCERVEECQSPVWIRLDVDPSRRVAMHAVVPREAPTTRGFASILVQGVTGLAADEVLALPDDLPTRLGLDTVVSPLRIAGMAGMLGRAKRQVAAQL